VLQDLGIVDAMHIVQQAVGRRKIPEIRQGRCVTGHRTNHFTFEERSHMQRSVRLMVRTKLAVTCLMDQVNPASGEPNGRAQHGYVPANSLRPVLLRLDGLTLARARSGVGSPPRHDPADISGVES
jgi:hypothetical protein